MCVCVCICVNVCGFGDEGFIGGGGYALKPESREKLAEGVGLNDLVSALESLHRPEHLAEGMRHAERGRVVDEIEQPEEGVVPLRE
jgi:hypothetical protein